MDHHMFDAGTKCALEPDLTLCSVCVEGWPLNPECDMKRGESKHTPLSSKSTRYTYPSLIMPSFVKGRSLDGGNDTGI